MKKIVVALLILVSSFCFAKDKPNLKGANIVQHGVCTPTGMNGQYYCLLLHKDGKFYISVWQAKFDDAEMTVTPEKEVKIYDENLNLLWEDVDV